MNAGEGMAPLAGSIGINFVRRFVALFAALVAALLVPRGSGADSLPTPSPATAPTPYSIYVTPHSHIDMVWYWTYDQTRVLVTRILGQALAMLKSDPRFTFTQDQMAALEPFWETLDEPDRRFLRRAIAEGRFEVTTGMYVQPDVAGTDFESLVRQYLAARPWLEKTLGAQVTTAWNIDTYGQTVQMPQLFARGGLRYAVFMRDVPPELAGSLQSPFRWRSPDGSEVLAFWLSATYDIHGRRLAEKLRVLANHNTPGNDKLLLPWGTDLYYPTERTERIEQEIREAAKEAGLPIRDVRFSTPRRYFEDVARSKVAWPVYRYDFNPPLFTADLRGLYGQRPSAKLANRATEDALETAEKFASVAAAFGSAYPAEELRLAWKKLLFNQHHDALPGSHTEPVEVIMMSGYAGASETARTTLDAALWQISRRIDTSGVGQFAFVVFNALSFPRSEAVHYVPLFKEQLRNFQLLDPHNQPVPFRLIEASRRSPAGPLSVAALEFVARDVPPLGYRTYHIVAAPGAIPGPVWEPVNGAVTNAFFALKIDSATGSIASLIDRRSGAELLDTRRYGGNELVLEEEKDPDCEGMIHLTGTELRAPGVAPGAIEQRRDGIGATLRIRGQFLAGQREQTIDLYEELPRIDFQTRLLGFPGHDGLLSAAFPLARGHGSVLYETHNAVVERPHGIYNAQTWTEAAAGDLRVALLNQGTGGCHTEEGLVRLILLRSITNYRGYYSPGAAEKGDHEFHYSLYPHREGWEGSGVIEQAHSFNSPLRVVAVGEHKGGLPGEGSFLRIAEGGFEITTLKRSEDGQAWILRGHETRGRRGHVGVKLHLPFHRAWLADLLERPMRPIPLKADALEFDCEPFQFVTIRLAAPTSHSTPQPTNAKRTDTKRS